MYGRKKYRSLSKLEEQPIVNNNEPTYLCGRCNKIKLISDCVEVTALDKGTIFMYTRLCHCCAIMLQTWIKA